MVEAVFKIENPKTTALAEKVEVLASIISILLAMIEELSTKPSSKETFA